MRGADSVQLVGVWRLLGTALVEAGEDMEAAEVLETALLRFRERTSGTNANMGHVLIQLSRLYRRIGELELSLRMAQEARWLFEVRFGADGIDAARANAEIARTIASLGREGDAEPLLAEAAERMRCERGFNPLLLADALGDLGALRVNLGEGRDAETPLRESLHIYQQRNAGPERLSRAEERLRIVR